MLSNRAKYIIKNENLSKYLQFFLRPNAGCEPKVTDLEGHGGGEKHVAELEVPVDDVLRVNIVHAVH